MTRTLKIRRRGFPSTVRRGSTVTILNPAWFVEFRPGDVVTIAGLRKLGALHVTAVVERRTPKHLLVRLTWKRGK